MRPAVTAAVEVRPAVVAAVDVRPAVNVAALVVSVASTVAADVRPAVNVGAEVALAMATSTVTVALFAVPVAAAMITSSMARPMAHAAAIAYCEVGSMSMRTWSSPSTRSAQS